MVIITMSRPRGDDEILIMLEIYICMLFNYSHHFKLSVTFYFIVFVTLKNNDDYTLTV